jgi:type I restriction enzyme S subunit
LPFSIPYNWTWCRGKDCFSGMQSRKPQGSLFKYIDIDAIDNHNHCIKSPKVIETSKAPSRASRAVFCGSVLFSLVRPYLQNIAFISSKNEDCIASTGFYVCTSTGTFLPEYMYYLMLSPYVIYGLNQYMKGDNSPSIKPNNIEEWLYPVPPLEEQKRIVNYIDKLMSFITKLDSNIT